MPYAIFGDFCFVHQTGCNVQLNFKRKWGKGLTVVSLHDANLPGATILGPNMYGTIILMTSLQKDEHSVSLYPGTNWLLAEQGHCNAG